MSGSPNPHSHAVINLNRGDKIEWSDDKITVTCKNGKIIVIDRETGEVS